MMPDPTQQALLFMPDISGFTQFVSETEVMHSRHIVQDRSVEKNGIAFYFA